MCSALYSTGFWWISNFRTALSRHHTLHGAWGWSQFARKREAITAFVGFGSKIIIEFNILIIFCWETDFISVILCTQLWLRHNWLDSETISFARQGTCSFIIRLKLADWSVGHACWAVGFVQTCSSWSTSYLDSFWDWQITTSQKWMDVLVRWPSSSSVARGNCWSHPQVAIWRAGWHSVSYYAYTYYILLYVYIPCSSSAVHHSRPIIFPIKMIQNWLSAGFVRQWGTAHHFTKHHISNNIAQCINVCPIFFPADSGRHGAQHEPIHWCFSIRDLHGVFTGAQFFKRSTPCEIQWCIIICHIKTAIMPFLYKNQVCTFITKGIVRYTCSVVRAVGFNFYLHLDGQESWLRVYHESWPFFRPPCHLFSWEVTKVPVQYWLITM